MKISVSVSSEDLADLDRYVALAGLGSRSAGVQHAIRRLRDPQLEADYAAAWAEWDTAGEEEAWSTVTADGVPREAR